MAVEKVRVAGSAGLGVAILSLRSPAALGSSPDVPVSQNGHTLTDTGSALAAYNGKLYLAYKGSAATTNALDRADRSRSSAGNEYRIHTTGNLEGWVMTQ